MALAAGDVTALCRDCFWTGADPGARCPSCRSLRLVRHAELDQLSMAHLDCDAFYASVEKRDRPELRDQPLIVGGGARGVVTTCCYIARMSGVRSAMPMFKARKLCPQAAVLPPDFAKYRMESRRIMAKLRDMTPLVQPLSLDEAWVDLAGTDRLHGATPALTLARLQADIEREVRITVSIGLAANKFLAKIASDLDKPRGFAVIGAAEAEAFLAPRPVSILPGVGEVFARTLQSDGYALVGDLAAEAPKRLADRYGVHGLRLSQLAKGQDARAINPHEGRKSLSAETTFETDISALADLEDILWRLCEKVAGHARSEAIAGRVVTLKLRATDFRIVTRRRTLPFATQTARSLFAASQALLTAEARGRPWRLIGVGISDIVESDLLSGDLFDNGESRALSGERAIDALRGRFGADAIFMGRTLKR
ncbi:MAG TPA: DNA polymerase IV [Caulobacteraceae bacterium]|jgi:DNA polymerase-4|nr:DNA polymerase IV [Caulobacteraceae bacterium]